MKKNYITPNTEMTTFASMGLMDDPIIGVAAGSGGAAVASTSEANMID